MPPALDRVLALLGIISYSDLLKYFAGGECIVILESH